MDSIFQENNPPLLVQLKQQLHTQNAARVEGIVKSSKNILIFLRRSMERKLISIQQHK
ncbi:MAG: hypothetical protein ACTS73_01310 [Arsenophonus sp. NEOnobi-MAG3]